MTLSPATSAERVRVGGLHPAFAVVAIPAVFALIGLVVRYYAARAAIPDLTLSAFPDALCRWDCDWYVRIAETGYDTYPVPSMVNGGNWAFFPLSPLIVFVARHAIALPTIITATAVSIAISYLTALAAWPLIRGNWRAYALFSAYLLAGPFSIYFTTFYTEALFMLLTTVAFASLARGNYVGAGMAAGLLSATRIVGVFMTLAILANAIQTHLRAGGSIRALVPALLRRPDIVFALCVAPLGLAAYGLFLHLWMGDGLAFSHVQRAWARSVGNPIGVLADALADMPQNGWFPSSPQLLAIAALTGFVPTGILAWRRAWPAAIFCAACLIVPLAAGTASLLRFTAALAPLALTACDLLSRNRIVFMLTLIGLILAGYGCTYAWMTGNVTLV